MNAAAKPNSVIELLKSLVVIPLVIAIVMGTGWGLVRWAEARQVKSGKPERQPAVKAADGSIELQRPFVEITGHIGYQRGPEPVLANWRTVEDSASWHFPIDTPGRYAVELGCSCDAADAGSEIEVRFDGTPFQTTIPDTGGWKTFKTIRVGEVDVSSSGWHDLRIAPVAVAKGTAMMLKSVRLVPVKS